MLSPLEKVPNHIFYLDNQWHVFVKMTFSSGLYAAMSQLLQVNLVTFDGIHTALP